MLDLHPNPLLRQAEGELVPSPRVGGRDRVRGIGRARKNMLRLCHFIWIAIALIVAGCASEQPATVARALAPGEFADTILTNGKIVTVDERFSVAEALAVRGGRIIAVGSNADIAKLAGSGTHAIHLRGRTV